MVVSTNDNDTIFRTLKRILLVPTASCYVILSSLVVATILTRNGISATATISSTSRRREEVLGTGTSGNSFITATQTKQRRKAAFSSPTTTESSRTESTKENILGDKYYFSKIENPIQWNVSRRFLQWKPTDIEQYLHHRAYLKIDNPTPYGGDSKVMDILEQQQRQQQQQQQQQQPQQEDSSEKSRQRDLWYTASTMTPSSVTTRHYFPFCDAAFASCAYDAVCHECFLRMQENNIDWADLASGTPCNVLLEFLDHLKLPDCQKLNSRPGSKKLFCDTFDTCTSVLHRKENETIPIECSELTECNWPGMHSEFLGDGICHDDRFGCYNHPICNYDGGDCCLDTCMNSSKFILCGELTPWNCRDPNSTECNLDLVNNLCNSVPHSTTNSNWPSLPPKHIVTCIDNEALFRLTMFDSFGDGWQGTNIIIYDPNESRDVFDGGLVNGDVGSVDFCLNINTATCFEVRVAGGMWGREASWELRKASGGVVIASGGAPMQCTFSVGTNLYCRNTCLGRANTDPKNDADYLQMKDLHECIQQKCAAQTFACTKDEKCVSCYQEDIYDYCYSVPSFLALTDCTVCRCAEAIYLNNSTPASSNQLCTDKYTPGIAMPPPVIKGFDQQYEKKPCTTAEIYEGGSTILTFSNCSKFNATAILLEYDSKFDQNNFGALDQFEACAHKFSDSRDISALGCLQILANAASAVNIIYSDDLVQNDDVQNEDDVLQKKLPIHAIAQLANSIYYNGERFCDCARVASIASPLCPSFMNFKTFLFEALDACNALDEIDCDAWIEFSRSCRKNVINVFQSDELLDEKACTYVINGCGGSGPLPRFRRLDCEEEVSEESWNFYQKFVFSCGDDFQYRDPFQEEVNDDDSDDVSLIDDDKFLETMVPERPESTTGSSTASTAAKKPYVPPEERGKNSVSVSTTTAMNPSQDRTSQEETVERKSHWFRNVAVVCIGIGILYHVQKKRTDGFNFVQYRQVGGGVRQRYNPNDYCDEIGIAMESTSSASSSVNAFQPPTL